MNEENPMTQEHGLARMDGLALTGRIEEYKRLSNLEDEAFWNHAPFSLVQETLMTEGVRIEDLQNAQKRRTQLSEQAERNGVLRAARAEITDDLESSNDFMSAVNSLGDTALGEQAERDARLNLKLDDGSNYSDQANANYHDMMKWSKKSAATEFMYKEMQGFRQAAGGQFPDAAHEAMFRKIQDQYNRMCFFDTGINPHDHIQYIDDNAAQGLNTGQTAAAGGPPPPPNRPPGTPPPAAGGSPPPGGPPPGPDWDARMDDFFNRFDAFMNNTGPGAGVGNMADMFDAMRGMFGNNERLNIPENAREQLNMIRPMLDEIENSNRDAQDFAISRQFVAIEAALPRMAPEVRREVKARLAVHDASELIRQANGWIDPPPNVGARISIGGAFGEAVRRGHGLDDNIMSLFLKEDWRGRIGEESGVASMQGYDVAASWDLLQDANYNYRDMIQRVNIYRAANGEEPIDEAGYQLYDADPAGGQAATNYFNDSHTLRKNAVKAYMVAQLESRPTVDDTRNAAKSLQLAEKLTIATLKTSVFNRSSAVGNDQLAECIGLKTWRKSRASAGRNRGPKVHEDMVDGFGNSWDAYLANGGEGRNVDTPLYARDIDPRKIDKLGWEYYGTVYVNRFWEMKKLLMDRSPKPRSVNLTFLQGAVAHFNTCDKPGKWTQDMIDEDFAAGTIDRRHLITPAAARELVDRGKTNVVDDKVWVGKDMKMGKQQLRLWWVAGVLDMALADVELGWDRIAIEQFRDSVSRDEMAPGKGAFISPEQWKWLEKELNYVPRLITLSMQRQIRQMR